MKARLLYIIGVSMIGMSAMAQDAYDAANFSQSDLNGTARYVAMGGALGALGGDISTMGSNPAGIGLFRRSEATLSLSAITTDEKGQLGHDATRGSLDQAGMVFVMDQGNRSSKGLQYVNFGVNYAKRRNHLGNASLDVQNLNGIFSQTYQLADLGNMAIDNDYFGGMAVDMSTPYYDEHGNIIKDGIVVDIYDNDGNLDHYEGCGAQSALYKRATYGSTSQVDFNLSFNVSDKFFWGVSVGVYDINYHRESFYYELGTDGNDYNFSNYYDTKGDGFDVKLGAIIRPIDNSPLRFGFSIHTPTWYMMEDVNGASLFYKGNLIDRKGTDPYEYSFRTPWKFGVSMGHTIGRNVAFGAEYEFSDPSSAKYDSRDWDNDAYFVAINTITKETLKPQHTFKVGLELKPADNFAIRAGYNYVSSPFKDDAFRTILYDGPFTETDYTNWGAINRYTLGVGFRFQGGFFDLAYQFQNQKGDFYAFDDQDLKPTEIKNNRSQILATLGFKF